MRPLTIADYGRGHLETLKSLTSVGEVGREEWVKRWRWMKRRNDDNDEGGKGDYFVIVVCDGTGKVVGTGTVVVERKLYVTPSITPFHHTLFSRSSLKVR